MIFGHIKVHSIQEFYPRSEYEDDKHKQLRKKAELPSTVALLPTVGHPPLLPPGSPPFFLRSHSLLQALVKGQTKEAPNLPNEP